ncbi:MAG: damage-control phosphatase ARMT1 family protein [Thermodesulfobacteriota bacterium]
MRTSPECLSCLRRQAKAAIGMASQDAATQRQVESAALHYLDRLDMSLSPPENATGLYQLIATASGCRDPFAAIKEAENRLALQWRDSIRQRILASQDPLRTACAYAVAGNIIDHGANHAFDAVAALDNCLERPFAIDDLERLRTEAREARKILYLADNCGEIVLDGLLAELLARQSVVTLAVRGAAVINDATRADAHVCGLDATLRIIDNGTACPGTPLGSCSKEFRQHFQEADLIISKGQGNFETLSEEGGPIYFLLTAKCAVVAGFLAGRSGKPVRIGDLILFRGAD